MNGLAYSSGGMNGSTSTLPNDTPRHSFPPRSNSIRVRIRPHAPLPEQPLLIPCIDQTTITAFKARIVTLFNAKSDSHFDPIKIRLEIEGYAIADDCMVGDVVREADVVEVYWEGGKALTKLEKVPKAKVHPRSESSDSSSSSSSSASSSSSSSSEDSESDSSESDSSSEEEDVQQHGTALSINGSVNGWVPPGQGSLRTQRNNEKRRKKARAEFNAEREKRLIETIKRVEKEALAVEQIDKGADREGNFAFDKKGDQATRSSSQNGKSPAAHFDNTVLLPPGGGLLGLPTADLSMSSSTMGQSSPSERVRKARQPRQILPPSQRQDPIPSCIRLTRVDCDECATPWPIEESAELIHDEEGDSPDGGDIAIANADALYLAFKAQGKEALKKMRADEEKQEEERAHRKESDKEESIQQAAMGLPVTFGKPNGWNGNEILTSKGLLSKEQNLSPDLDYGIPEDKERTETATETLDRLRKLRDQTKSSTPNADLLSIRQAALQSIMKKLSG